MPGINSYATIQTRPTRHLSAVLERKAYPPQLAGEQQSHNIRMWEAGLDSDFSLKE